MKFPILTAVVVFCLVIAYSTHRSKNYAATQEEDFWSRERAANETRKKSLDNLNFITIPLEKLPLTLHQDNNTIKEYTETIVELSKSPIVNLTGISNTDLKLKYGAANIDLLSSYDNRYTTLVSVLQRLAKALYDCGDIASAQVVLEYAVSIGSDVSLSYKLLGDIYASMGNRSGIQSLIEKSRLLSSPTKTGTEAYLSDLLERC